MEESINLITLAIALLAFGLATATFWWQVASFKLSGGRLKVENLEGLANIHARDMWTIQPGSLPPESVSKLKAEGYSLDVVGVTARNVGRMPVSVTRIQLVVRPTGVIYDPVNAAFGKPLPHRLDAGESEHWSISAATLRLAASAYTEDGTTGQSYVINVELGDGTVATTPPRPVPRQSRPLSKPAAEPTNQASPAHPDGEGGPPSAAS